MQTFVIFIISVVSALIGAGIANSGWTAPEYVSILEKVIIPLEIDASPRIDGTGDRGIETCMVPKERGDEVLNGDRPVRRGHN